MTKKRIFLFIFDSVFQCSGRVCWLYDLPKETVQWWTSHHFDRLSTFPNTNQRWMLFIHQPTKQRTNQATFYPPPPHHGRCNLSSSVPVYPPGSATTTHIFNFCFSTSYNSSTTINGILVLEIKKAYPSVRCRRLFCCLHLQFWLVSSYKLYISANKSYSYR